MSLTSILVYGSSRSLGHTRIVIDQFLKDLGSPHLIDLNLYEIGYFDYENKRADDDFLSIVQDLVKHDRIIFVTPVYWYSMSAQLKTFFDRLSDLLKFEKSLGRELRGKTMATMSVSQSDLVPTGFEMPFRETAHYLGMNYSGHVHISIQEDGNYPVDVRSSFNGVFGEPSIKE